MKCVPRIYLRFASEVLAYYLFGLVYEFVWRAKVEVLPRGSRRMARDLAWYQIASAVSDEGFGLTCVVERMGLEGHIVPRH